MGSLIGILIFLLVFILLIGNVSGWWPTFPFAGFITMGIGSLIIKLTKDE